jgi:hypothetical protein
MGQTCAAGFYPVFKDNMAAIGLTAPPNLFSSQVSALQTSARYRRSGNLPA